MLRVFVLLSVLYISVHCSDESQMRQSTEMVRSVCQPKHKISDDVVFGAREGKFPDDKAFKCYVQCVLEMMGMMKKNKVLYESAMKQFDVLLPEDYKQPYKHALEACKDATGGAKNACDAAYNFLKCFYDNNTKFTFALELAEFQKTLKIVHDTCRTVTKVPEEKIQQLKNDNFIEDQDIKQALTKEQIDEMTKKLLEDCAKKEGASTDEVANTVAHKTPTTKNEKCLHACVGESLGLIKDKKTDVEASVEIAKMAFGADDPKVSIARQISTECAGVTHDDRCEAAVKAYECGVAAGQKLGVKFEDLGL
ncbi:uncharacterized protein LOC129580383 [Sitodiplosis mosellana]|uniref:uncharacterized protein LOC129580383 n=1 Tax=Sitodiplosis mosellana TaxID=263140 RepID=UPI0024438F73|nr:uncharacterized protein LOC129580383 [Sitodiplosis mosellana]